jgi:prophage antirepressor-like protein
MPTADEPQLNCGCVFTFPSPIRTPTGGIQEFKVRQETIDGEPWFIAKDVCVALGLNAPHHAYKRLNPGDLVYRGQTSVGLHGGRPVATVNEGGLYQLILDSKKPTARPFRTWVTDEVLPAIRKTGGYMLKGADRQAIQEGPAP